MGMWDDFEGLLDEDTDTTETVANEEPQDELSSDLGEWSEFANFLEDDFAVDEETGLGESEDSYEVSLVDPQEEEEEVPEKKNFFQQMVDPYVQGAKSTWYSTGKIGANVLEAFGEFLPEGHLGKEALMKLGDSERKFWEAKKEALPDEQYQMDGYASLLDPNVFVYNMIHQAPMYVALLTPAGAAGMGLIGGGQIFSQTYDELREEGVDPQKAASFGIVNGIVGGLFEKLGGKYMIEGGKILMRGARGAIGEAATESMQSLEANLVTETAKGLDKGETAHEIQQRLLTALPGMVQEAGLEGTFAGMLGGGASVAVGKDKAMQEVEEAVAQAKYVSDQEKISNLRNVQEAAKREQETGEIARTKASELAAVARDELARKIQQAEYEKGPIGISVGPQGAFRNVYDEAGNLTGRKPLARHVSQQVTPTPEYPHIKSKTAGHKNLERIRAGLELESAEERAVREDKDRAEREYLEALRAVTPADVSDVRIEAQQEQAQGRAQESAQAIAGQPPTQRMVQAERGTDSAETLKEAPIYTPDTFQPMGPRSTAEEAGGVLEPAGPYKPIKSAEEAQEVLSENSEMVRTVEAEIAQAEQSGKPLDAQTIDDAFELVLSAKKAEDSMGVVVQSTDQMIEDFDDAMTAMQENRHKDAIDSLKKAVRRKGKNAEKSAKILEGQAPEDTRVGIARAKLAKALESGNETQINEATDEFSSALFARDRKEGRDPGPEPKIEQAPKPKKTAMDLEAEKEPAVFEEPDVMFDEESGEVSVPVAGVEEELIRREEGLEKDTPVAPAPRPEGVSKAVKAVVKHEEGAELTQAIIDGDEVAIGKALDKFPVSQRKQAWTRASKDAIDVTTREGQETDDVKFNIEENKDQVKWAGTRTTKGLKVSSLGNNIWKVNNPQTGKTYSIFKYKKKYIIKEGKDTLGTFGTMKDATDSLQTHTSLDYKVVDTGAKRSQNRFEVHGPDGLIDPEKRSGGKGYFTQKEAKKVAAQLNEVNVDESFEPTTKIDYTDSAREYAEGKTVAEVRKAPEKAPSKPVTVRKRKTSAQGRVEPKGAPRASESTKPQSEQKSNIATGIEGSESLATFRYNIEQAYNLNLKRSADLTGVEKAIEKTYTKLSGKKHLPAYARKLINVARNKEAQLDNVDPDALSDFTSVGKTAPAGNLKRTLDNTDVITYAKRAGKEVASIANLLESILPEGALNKAKVEVIDGSHPSGVPGFYSPRKGGTIYLYTKNSKGQNHLPVTMASTWLHESVHSVTAKALKDPKNEEIGKELDALRQKIADTILDGSALDYYNEYKDQENASQEFLKMTQHAKRMGVSLQELGFYNQKQARAVYMLLSNDEFLGNSANPDMKKLLQKLPASDQKNIIDKIKKFFQRILGFTEKEYTAYDQAMSAIGRLNDTYVEELADLDTEGLYDMAEEVFGQKDPDKDIAWVERFVEEETAKYEAQIESGDITASEKADVSSTVESLRSAKETFKDLAIGINERLHAINPRIAFKVRSEEGKMLRKNKDHQRALHAFYKNLQRVFKENKVSEQAQERFNLALLNQDFDIVEAFAFSDKKMKKSYFRMRKVVESIQKDLIDTGALREDKVIDDYLWHREIDDMDGLIKAMAKDPKYDSLSKELNAQTPKYVRMGLSEEKAKALVINDMLATGRRPATMRSVKGTKDRKFPKIPKDFAKYYKDPFESMANHIEESNEVVAMRRILGTTNIKNSIKELQRLEKQYEKNPSPELKLSIDRLGVSIDRYANSLEESVAGYVQDLLSSGEITTEQANEVEKLIRGRVTQVGITDKTLTAVRNVGLGMALGHVSNTLTQLKDGALIVYRHGLARTAISTVKTIMGKNNISANDYDLQRVMNEFRSGKGFNLNTIFNLTGFTQLDNFMKTVNLQSHIDTMQKLAKTEKGRAKIREKYGPAWGAKLTADVISQLEAGHITPDIKNIAITEMSKDVPVFLSEMPYAYNQAGNHRIWYTLKSYAIKVVNIAYRDGISKITKGKNMKTRMEGVYQLARLAVILGLMGGGVEELKDLLIGKETPFTENFTDEVLSLAFLSKYTLDQAQQKGPSSILSGLISVPAVSLIDVVYKGLQGSPEGLKYVPLPGAKELYYTSTVTGRKAIQTQTRRNIFARMKDEALSTGRVSPGLNRDIRAFNKSVNQLNRNLPKEERVNPITFTTVKKSIRRYRKAEKKRTSGASGALAVAEKVAGVLGPREAIAEDIPDYWTPEAEKIIDKHFPRLAKDMDRMTALSNLDRFVKTVVQAESSGDIKAKNPESTAKGAYQFIDDTVEPALKRLKKFIGWQPWMKELLKTKDVTTLDFDKQTLLFLAQMFEMDGSDKYMKGVLEGDQKLMSEAYYKLHHTAPDAATRANWVRAIKKINKQRPLLGD